MTEYIAWIADGTDGTMEPGILIQEDGGYGDNIYIGSQIMPDRELESVQRVEAELAAHGWIRAGATSENGWTDNGWEYSNGQYAANVVRA